MNDIDDVRMKFAAASVPLLIVSEPWVKRFDSVDGAFMMDVRRRRLGRGREDERIIICPGEGTDLRVVAVDPAIRQLVLEVGEPQRRMRFRRWRRRVGWVTEDHVVEARRRRILVGMDECHLFVCPLGRFASSVAEAHNKLAPRRVRGLLSRRHNRVRVKRQGEWFFIPVDDAATTQEIAELVSMGRILSKERVGRELVRAGRSHIADEVIRTPSFEVVRGRVRHPDHRVLNLRGWHLVDVNTEDRDSRIAGMTWVD